MESTPETSGRDDRTDLNCLLARLDSDPANAWEKYNSLRTRLVKFFDWNRCGSSEELADEVLDRVARKPQDEEIRDIHEFVIGVARNIRLEAYKKSQRESHLEDRPGGSEALAGSLDLERDGCRSRSSEKSYLSTGVPGNVETGGPRVGARLLQCRR